MGKYPMHKSKASSTGTIEAKLPNRDELIHTVFDEDTAEKLGGKSLYMMGNRLLIQEGKQFIFWRTAPDFCCPYCFEPVKVQCIIVPGDIYDIIPWQEYIEKMKRQKRNFELADFAKLDEKPDGTIWYYANELFGQIEKQCECKW